MTPENVLLLVRADGVAWRIVEGSAGSFLEPPGSALHSWEVWEGSLANPRGIYSIDSVVDPDHDWIPEQIRAKAKELIDEAVLIRSPLWEAELYGYFKKCYSPDGVERRADRLLIVGMEEPLYPEHPLVVSGEKKLSEYSSLNHGPVVRPDDPRVKPEHHAAFLLIRKFFPDAEPNLDLIASGGGYGARDCGRCGERVQYDAKIDAYAVYGTHSSECRGEPKHVVGDPAEVTTEEVK